MSVDYTGMYYLVPTADKSIASVKSNVLAAGVSLFFLYIVYRFINIRSIIYFKLLSHSLSIEMKNKEIK